MQIKYNTPSGLVEFTDPIFTGYLEPCKPKVYEHDGNTGVYQFNSIICPVGILVSVVWGGECMLVAKFKNRTAYLTFLQFALGLNDRKVPTKEEAEEIVKILSQSIWSKDAIKAKLLAAKVSEVEIKAHFGRKDELVLFASTRLLLSEVQL